MIKDEQKQSCHPEVAEPRQYGSHQELSVVAKEVAEPRQYGSHQELSAVAKEVPEPRQYGSHQELSAVAKEVPEPRQYRSKRAAFTLAEVLITLGIIGVVAAMTIPTLVKNYQKKVAVTRLRSTYTQLAQAVKLSESDNEEIIYWKFEGNWFEKYFRKYLKIQSTKLFLPVSNPNSIPYYRMYGGREQSLAVVRSLFGDVFVYTLQNGVDLIVGSYNKEVYSHYYKEAGIMVDINGVNVKPNKFGIDTFFITISNDINKSPIYFAGEYSTTEYETPRENLRDFLINDAVSPYNYGCNASGQGGFCGALIKYDGWQIKNDYPW